MGGVAQSTNQPTLTMDPHIRASISNLTAKQIITRFKGILSFSREQRSNKEKLIDHVLLTAPPQHLEFLRNAGAEKGAQQRENHEQAVESRKRKRNDQQNTRRKAQRMDTVSDEPRDHSKFLELRTSAQRNFCYLQFYNATANDAVAMYVCGVCAREVNTVEDKVTSHSLTSLPNVDRLVPRSPHVAHDLYGGKLLEPKGVKAKERL